MGRAPNAAGYGPSAAQVNVASGNIGGAQTAQQYVKQIEGVYEEVPLKGIVYWDSHAFKPGVPLRIGKVVEQDG